MLDLSNRNNWHTLLNAKTFSLKDGAKTAFVFVETDKEPIVITRETFRIMTVRYGSALQALGVNSGDLVVVAYTQSLESIFAFWGAMSIGAIPSMFTTLTPKLDPNVYMNNLSELVRISDVRAVLTTDDFAITLRERVACPVFSSSELTEYHETTFLLYTPEPDDIAFLQHSSGTTGLQKGVALSHRAVLNHVASYSESLLLNENDVIVSWLPLYHDMGLIAGFLLPLIQGIPLILMSPFDWVSHPALLLRTIQEYNGTLTWLPNFAYNHMARRIRQRDTENISLASVRAFINCSEPVHAESHALFLERFAPNGVTPEMLTVSYAMAENTFAVTQTPLQTATRVLIIDRVALQAELTAIPVPSDHPTATQQVSCGKPIAGVEVKVVNPQGASLYDMAVGEVLVRSNSMLTEYYKRADLNPFDAEGWYRTGDRGYLLDGEVYIIGRSKDLIINAGKNVYPQDIEAIVNGVAGIHAGRAVVFGVPDEREGTELIAVVAEVDTQDPEERRQILQAIRQTVVQQSEVTVNFVKLVAGGWLIKTSSGKIARSQNRDKWLSEQAQ